MRKCEIEGCERPYLAKGMCRSHYERARYVRKPSDRGPLEERFWRKVRKGASRDECWAWLGTKNVAGYGVIWGGPEYGIPRGAHRVSYEIHHGPAGDGVVMHSCDNPECTNPLHLSIGTHHLNALDKMAKQRHEFGVRRWNAKLTNDDVLAIRADKAISNADLARRYGVSGSVISNVRNGKTWKHV